MSFVWWNEHELTSAVIVTSNEEQSPSEGSKSISKSHPKQYGVPSFEELRISVRSTAAKVYIRWEAKPEIDCPCLKVKVDELANHTNIECGTSFEALSLEKNNSNLPDGEFQLPVLNGFVSHSILGPLKPCTAYNMSFVWSNEHELTSAVIVTSNEEQSPSEGSKSISKSHPKQYGKEDTPEVVSKTEAATTDKPTSVIQKENHGKEDTPEVVSKTEAATTDKPSSMIQKENHGKEYTPEVVSKTEAATTDINSSMIQKENHDEKVTTGMAWWAIFLLCICLFLVGFGAVSLVVMKKRGLENYKIRFSRSPTTLPPDDNSHMQL